MPKDDSLRIVAVMAAYNEADILGASIEHLVDQGIHVYLIDDGSTDGTLEVARRYLGRGLLDVEALPPAGPPGVGHRFALSRILERKEQLADSLDADWFINQDCDEFRDSPWPHLTLRGAVALVDRLGWNAIDFEVLNFVPEGDGYHPGDSLAHAFRRYAPGAPYDRMQVRCWKKTGAHADLVANAGHDVQFPGRRVFPIRFPLRHYPIRSEAHGQRKVFAERRPVFDPQERAAGWHVQYDNLTERLDLDEAWGPAATYDRDEIAVGLQVRNRLTEDAERLEAESAALREALRQAIAASERSRLAEAEALAGARAAASRVENLETERQRLTDACARLAADAQDLSTRLDAVFGSWSWRATGPARMLWKWLGGR